MNLSIDVIIIMTANLITLGAFYGAIKTEIYWIKKTLDRLDKNYGDKIK